jgi:hypothetical protein
VISGPSPITPWPAAYCPKPPIQIEVKLFFVMSHSNWVLGVFHPNNIAQQQLTWQYPEKRSPRLMDEPPLVSNPELVKVSTGGSL